MRSSSNGPFISVVIPTYNRAQPTIAAIESALAQTYSNVEIVIVDDGSTDGTGELVRQYIQEHSGDKALRFVQQSNGGAGAARNAGIDEARGDYIAFLDSDDEWFPEKLELQVQALEQLKDECGACFTDARCVDNSGMDVRSFELFARNYSERFGIDRGAVESIAKSFCGFWVSTLLARADLIRQIGGFDPQMSFAEDRDFYFRLSLVTPLAYVNVVLACSDRNRTPQGSSCRPWDKAEVRLAGEQRMYESWLELNGAFPSEVKRVILHQLRATHSSWANWHIENKHFHDARLEVSKAARFGLTAKLAMKWILIWLAPPLARKFSAKTKGYLSES